MARLRAQARCCKSCCAWHTVREFPRVSFRMIFRRRSGIFGSIATILSVLHICGIMSGCGVVYLFGVVSWEEERYLYGKWYLYSERYVYSAWYLYWKLYLYTWMG